MSVSVPFVEGCRMHQPAACQYAMTQYAKVSSDLGPFALPIGCPQALLEDFAAVFPR